MRVALACDWFLKYTCAQAAAMARAGADVVLLCRDHSLEFGGDADERHATIGIARDAGVLVLEAPGRLWDPKAVPVLLRIRRRIARFAPEVIHLHDGSVDPRALALLPRVTTVMTVHDPTVHPGHPEPRLLARRWVLESSKRALKARAKAVVIHSDHLRPEVELRPGQRCVVVPHGLDLRDEPLSPPRLPVVGFFGRLQPYKGIEVLARAMPRVWETRPDVELRVSGSGPVDVPLADPRVRLNRAYLPESGVEAFFRNTSLAVLPYTQASQTGAGSVAVGFGVPVVASRLGGLPDLALDDTYLFDAGDDAGLAKAILSHIDDDDAVRSRVLTEVAAPKSWDATAVALLELYAQLLREP
ncbi:MAG: glycosyltransferase family 4 protein [Actinomycetota bacterium]|nr:glycosyltransferase family 4 protein [Actinomycetota bacterium]